MAAPDDERGKYDWDTDVRNKSYTHQIRYYCPSLGMKSTQNQSILQQYCKVMEILQVGASNRMERPT